MDHTLSKFEDRIRKEKEAEKERIRQEKQAEEDRLRMERMEREAEDRRRSKLPGEHANNREEQICKGRGDGGEDRGICGFGNLEAPGEALHQLYSHITQKNNGSGFNYVSPTSTAH